MISYLSTSNAKFAIWFIGVFKRTLHKFLFNELAKSSHFNSLGCGRPKAAGICLAKDERSWCLQLLNSSLFGYL